MKRQFKNHLSGRRLILPALTVLALSILAVPTSARAAVRIGVRVNTPAIDAVLYSGGRDPGLQIRIPDRQHLVVVTKADQRVARKLAKRTVYTKQELLQLRRVGYSWNQIGQLLRLPQSLMRSVLQGQGTRCGNDRWDNGRNDRRDDRRDDRQNRPLKKGQLTR